MHPSLLLLLLSLNLIPPLSAASSPPLHLSKTHLHHRKSLAAPPQQYIEVTRPLPFDSLTPSCTLPLFSHAFSNTSGHPGAANATYSSPTNCSWSNAVLQFSAAANGSQRGRIAAVWLSGAELLRTSTPDPTSDGIFWNFRKDVTRYASLLRRSNLTLSVMLHHLLHTQTYHVNITLLYYDVNSTATVNKSLELNENPADMIIPISSSSANGDREGLWFKIEQESDPLLEEIKIPANTYRAVIEIYVSFHEKDEFWYTNPPDYYLEINNLPMQRGHGPHREVVVKVDDNVVGTVIPFPIIMAGGIIPLFWEPLVSIGAFDFPSYELELTPFLGTLLDRSVSHHFLKVEVAETLPYWLVGGNMHLWLDNNAGEVEAGPIKYSDPSSSCLDRESKFHELDGKCKVGGERKREVSGWVRSSAGNFTTHVYSKVEFESKIVFKHNGTKKTVKQEVKVSDKVEVVSSDLGRRSVVGGVSRERRYPLRLTTTAVPGSEEDTYLISAELEQSVKEEKREKGLGFRGKWEKREKCRGWMFVRGCEMLSGAATTSQNYYVKDGYGCYTRRVVAEGGAVRNDTDNFLCATSAASS